MSTRSYISRRCGRIYSRFAEANCRAGSRIRGNGFKRHVCLSNTCTSHRAHRRSAKILRKYDGKFLITHLPRKHAHFSEEGTWCHSSESQRESGELDMVAQRLRRTGKQEWSSSTRSGDGRSSAIQQDHRLDHKTILASPWRAKMPNKKKHQQLPLPISA
jgi:hypothetical protein